MSGGEAQLPLPALPPATPRLTKAAFPAHLPLRSAAAIFAGAALLLAGWRLLVASRPTLPLWAEVLPDLILLLLACLALSAVFLRELTRTAKLAITDGLTGLFNHRHMQQRLAEEVARAERFGHPVSALMIDIDRFKRFNGTYGHQAGDRVLAAIARLIRETIRATDVPARYGGEELAVILPQTSLVNACGLAERLRAAVDGLKFQPRRAAHPVRVTISVGVATYPDHAANTAELIDGADQALFQAKRDGRNLVRAFERREHPREPVPAVERRRPAGALVQLPLIEV
ncbi:MAG TPA: diguanylate cyclase [Candidatus Methylomirabilis sp.]|nr:diguanylate cyclase [Candidatus Methylomirabilis sp.]